MRSWTVAYERPDQRAQVRALSAVTLAVRAEWAPKVSKARGVNVQSRGGIGSARERSKALRSDWTRSRIFSASAVSAPPARTVAVLVLVVGLYGNMLCKLLCYKQHRKHYQRIPFLTETSTVVYKETIAKPALLNKLISNNIFSLFGYAFISFRPLPLTEDYNRSSISQNFSTTIAYRNLSSQA